MKDRDDRILELLETIAHELKQSNQINHKIMTALDTLTAAIGAATASATALTAAVDTAVTDITTPGATDAQLLTLATSVTGLQNAIDAQTQRLITATTPVTPPAPPTPTPVA